MLARCSVTKQEIPKIIAEEKNNEKNLEASISRRKKSFKFNKLQTTW
jgi:hypothetical protein